MENNNPVSARVNYREVWRRIWGRRRLFYKMLPITFILSAVYICSFPRYYSTEAKLAPETESGLAAGAFGSIASSFGIELGDEGTDAITPMLYPDLLEDNGFITSLYPIMVETEDGEVKTNYHDYLLKHQKHPWWGGITRTIGGLFRSKDKKSNANNEEFDPYALSKDENTIVETIRDNISCDVDKKTGVITVVVVDQDPKVCKIIADSLILRLQNFITNYRTNKAHRDVEYYTALVDSALTEYKAAFRLYNQFADANSNAVLPSYRTKMSDMENEMQLRYSTYTALSAQLQNAKGKVQERTPAFTLLKGAAKPIKPAGPKRMFFVAFMLFLVGAITGCYILKDILLPDDKTLEKVKTLKTEDD